MMNQLKWTAILLLFSTFFLKSYTYAQITQERLKDQDVELSGSDALHLTSSTNPFGTHQLNIISPDAWLYLDNIRPSDVIAKYKNSIMISSKPIKVGKDGNARIAVYRQGAVVIPQDEFFQPLEVFTEKDFKGQSHNYRIGKYYTNNPASEIETNLVLPMEKDKSIRSFKLKKGYMATVAIQPDGLGYSRVFIADSADLEVASLPISLDKKIAFIRILPWQWPSKKGWCGGRSGTVLSTGINRQDNEIDLTQSTWFYSWGTSDPINPNAEFAPMKWGLGGSMKSINERSDVTHLLGYNEPNRPDQSNMSVAQALDEWPQLMKSGLRLGSPSVSDNSRLEDWLYRFIDECDKRNYRVDFVNVHAYWGAEQMPSPEAWYKKLREIHLRTGRPIWITEWNIGANWTKEPWPSDREEQFQKHLKDLKNVLQVMDTASFIERYSIYNWVEDKRAMILDSSSFKMVDGKRVTNQLLKQTLTPAGRYYRDDRPRQAFNPYFEVVKEYQVNIVPDLNYKLDTGKITLKWSVGSSEDMIERFTVDKAINDGKFVPIEGLNPSVSNSFEEMIDKVGKERDNRIYYRIRATDAKGDSAHLSNTISYHYIQNESNGVTILNIISATNWEEILFANPYSTAPYIIFGTPTNRNKAPQTHRVRNLTGDGFEFKLDLWKYLKNTEFNHKDTIPVIIVNGDDKMKLKGIDALVNKVENVNENWTEVSFEKPFAVTPVVFASQVSSGDEATTSVRVRNVNKKGFEVKLQYEAAYNPFNVSETIHYLAITPGEGTLNDKNISVGLMNEPVVGDFFNSVKIEFGKKRYKNPAFFGSMQSESDDVTSALRIKNHGPTYVEVFKEKEVSKGNKPVQKETIGWIIIETE